MFLAKPIASRHSRHRKFPLMPPLYFALPILFLYNALNWRGLLAFYSQEKEFRITMPSCALKQRFKCRPKCFPANKSFQFQLIITPAIHTEACRPMTPARYEQKKLPHYGQGAAASPPTRQLCLPLPPALVPVQKRARSSRMMPITPF